MSKRIWELDALRGICILGMVAVHFIYDLGALLPISESPVFIAIKQWGGLVFLVLSGICVTLGRHCVRRGLIVFLCGLLCSGVIAGMYFLGFADRGLIIYFGILHCLGSCMLLWPVFRRLPVWALACFAAAVLAVDILKPALSCPPFWLIPLGYLPVGCLTSDYFPLLPHLGFFLLGTVIGRTLYRKKESLFPGVDTHFLPVRFLCICGRKSLFIYLLHQPAIYGILTAFAWFTN